MSRALLLQLAVLIIVRSAAAQPGNGFTFDGADTMSAEDLMVGFCYTCHEAIQSCSCFQDTSIPQLQLPQQPLPTHIDPQDLDSNLNSQATSSEWLEDQNPYAQWAHAQYFQNNTIDPDLDMQQLGIPTRDSQARPFLTLNTDNLLRVNSISPQSFNGSVSSCSPGAETTGEQSTSELPPKPKRRRVAAGGPLKCHCGARYTRECDLRKHQKHKHTSKAERPHKCDQCDAKFFYPKDVERHQRSKHQDTASSKVYCHYSVCQEHGGFSRSDNLARHVRQKHSTSTVVTEASAVSGNSD